MSIIEEALRRAERVPELSASTQRPLIEASPRPAAPVLQRARRATADSGVGTYLILGIVVSMLLTVWWIRWADPHLTSPRLVAQPAAAPLPPAHVATLPPTGMETPPLPAAAVLEPPPFSPPRFRLSGIVTQPGEPLAVINDRVVHVGDVIDEAKVVDITPTGVTLQRNDALLTLRFSR